MDDGVIERLVAGWDGEELIIRYDRDTAATIVLAIHSTARGAATGGTRMKAYPSLAAAVEDAQRLARAMTYKLALADLPRSGGKAVIAAPPGLSVDARAGLLRRWGALVKQLGGLYETAADVGTTPADMDIVAEAGAPYVYGRTPENGGYGASGPPTALGVSAAMQAAARHLWDTTDLRGRTVLIQGAGSVGRPLAGLLIEAGARVLVSDLNAAAVNGIEAEFIAPDVVYSTPCDIFAPCALGAILNEATIPQLRCAAVVGSANNQLATDGDASRLKERGILYVPDYAANAGGIIALILGERLGRPAQEITARLWGIRSTVGEIIASALATGTTTLEAADRVAGSRM